MLDGEMYNKVKVEECTWLLVDKKVVVISLEKVGGEACLPLQYDS